MRGDMHHLSEDQLCTAAFDDMVEDQVKLHLDDCDACRRQLLSLQRLAETFALARRSQPSVAQLDRYQKMAPLIQQAPSSVLERLSQLHAALMLDSRQRLGFEGVRSGGQHSYRLLYSAENADVELLVDAVGQTRRIEGEVLPLSDTALRPPLLIELYAGSLAGAEALWMAESNQQGRFRLDGVTLGKYDVMITAADGPSLRIEAIEIT